MYTAVYYITHSYSVNRSAGSSGVYLRLQRYPLIVMKQHDNIIIVIIIYSTLIYAFKKYTKNHSARYPCPYIIAVVGVESVARH